jgi:small-conductance mechanosensitive channel
MPLESLSTFLNYKILTIGETSILVSNIAAFLLIFLLFIIIHKLNRHFFNNLRAKADEVNAPTIYMLERFIHYALMALAIIISLSALGLDMTHLALLATALSVGIGFGLQSIFNNFFSGIIILFERSLKVGDYIEIDNSIAGTVMEINIRSTRIKTRDNLDVLVPNSEFVNGRVTNWTLDDPTRRINVPFGVAYGSDKALVEKAALEAAKRVPFTLYGNDSSGKSIDPYLLLTNFGESSLDFQLVAWVNPKLNPRSGALVATYLWEIETSLNEHGIEIPFPQRDIHIK